MSNAPAATSKMLRTPIFGFLISTITLATCWPHDSSHRDILVKTNSFAVQGAVWPNNSEAHFYGNIPYAEPPVGESRWRPPVTKAPSSEIINGSWFGPSCIQYSNGEETVYSEYLSGFLLSPGQSQSEGTTSIYLK